MTTKALSQQEFYQKYKDEVLGLAPEFTDFSPGSLHDILAGALTIALNEVTELVISEFSKTFFDLAEGSDLERLAKDHFGDSFARPAMVKATGSVTFSRPNTANGNVTIPAGTVVKTRKDSQGQEQRFLTQAEVIMTGTSVSAEVEAAEAGTDGNVIATRISVVESSLTDPSVTVSNPDAMAGGTDEMADADYREYIRSKILALSGATEAAVRGAALAVPGVSFAALTTRERVVIDYSIEDEAIAEDALFFRIPYPVIYIADENGNSSTALVEAVKSAIHFARAAGVKIEVLGAVAYTVDWTASVTLNPAGPNYSILQSDMTMIKDSMKAYIDEQLAIGSGFSRSAANAHILSVWGAAGTNDITAFSTSVPGGDVAGAAGQKLIAGTMEIV